MIHLFAHHDRLWLLLGLLPMTAWVVRGSRLRSREWRALGESGRAPGDGSWGWLVAMGLVVLALGQPRWGRILGRDAPSGHDVVVVVDVSRSMAAEDAVPDRLGVAIEAGSSLLRALENGEGNRAAVVAFAGRGVVRCPLTSSLDAANDVLRSRKVGEIEPGGTDLGSALDAAIGAFDEEEHAEGRTIIIFSDGEDHVGSWTSIINRLRADGIIVHSVAIGDPEKSYPVPSTSKPGPEKPDETRRNDLACQELAKATGGAVVALGLASADLGSLFRDKIEPTARSRREGLRLPERVERFPAFLLGAIGFGLVASWPGLARRRARRLAMAVVVVAFASPGAGPSPDDAARLVEQGRIAYAEGRFVDSLAAFDRAITLAPKAAVPRFDAASALFQLRRYLEAITRYEEARELGDVGLSIKIDYALGNAHLAIGDIAGAIASYENCVASTRSGPTFDAVRNDARENREFAAKRLPPQPEQPEGGGPNPPGSNRPKGRPGEPKGNPGEDDPSNSSPANSSGDKPEGQAKPNGGSRGAGGAGGSGQAPPPNGSPDSRLDAALKDIREARNRRPPDPPPATSKGVGKDW
jgi:Ca-activated chloride channel family protein